MALIYNNNFYPHIGLSLVFLVIACLLSSDLKATEGQKTDHFTRADGLPHRHIIDLVEGPSGRLWISTIQGIGYFDGHRIREVPVRINDGTQIQPFRSRFVQDANDNIWAIPTLGALELPILIEHANGYIPEYFQLGGSFQLPAVKEVTRFNYQSFAKSEQGKKTKSLIGKQLGYEGEDLSGIPLWRMLFKLVGIEIPDIGQIIDIITALEDNNYVIWITGSSFLWVYDDFQKFKIIDWPDRKGLPASWNPNLPLTKGGQFIYPVKVENDSLIMSSFELPLYYRTNSRGIIVDFGYSFWFFTNSEKILNYQSETSETTEYEVTGDLVFSIFPAGDESLWVGTMNGLYRLCFRGRHFRNLQSHPFNLDERAPVGFSARRIIETNKGDFFTFENYGSLFKKPVAGDSLERLQETIPGNERGLHIQDMLYIGQKDSPADILLATSVGLFFWNSEDNVNVEIKNNHTGKTLIRLIEIEGSDQILVVTNSNEYYYFDPFQLQSSNLRKFSVPEFKPLVSKGGFLYGNSLGRLVEYNLETDQGREVFSLRMSRDASLDDIREIVIADNIMWLGTFEGLYGLDHESFEVLYHFNEEDGLPGSFIYSMIHDGRGFWLGTDLGLTYLETETGQMRSFFEEDGLSHNEFNSLSSFIDSRGLIWMGGLNGINIFDPDELRARSQPPKRLFLNDLTIFDRDYNTAEYLHFFADEISSTANLRPGLNSFNAEVAYIAPGTPGGANYTWYLEGFEAEWTNRSSDPIISYRNIPPGTYNLKVKAFDIRGNPAANTITLPLKVEQYWYLSSGAWVFWILLALMAAFYSVRFVFLRKLERQRVLKLEELDRQKSNLYTNITHEFRTPLTVILGLSGQDENHAASKTEMLGKFKRIEQGGRQLLNLVNQLLDLARLESGEAKLDLQTVKISGFFKYLVYSFNTIADIKGLELHFEFLGEKEATALIDAQRIQQVVSNLISNAIKFTPEKGTVLARAEIKQHTGSDEYSLYFEVNDTGPGIPADKMEVIFDRFHRLNTELTNNTPGTGIGLALAKELIELMGGTIGVKPNDNGATFYFSMGLQKIEPTGDSFPEIKGLNEKINLSDLDFSIKRVVSERTELQLTEVNSDRQSILIIEDHPDVLQYIKSCIPEKFDTHIAMDGLEGFEKATSLVPDLIISDVMMPRMDGYALCDQLKNNRITSHIPVLLLTAKSDDDSRMVGLKKGADAYLIKPFNKKELLLRIDNMSRLTEKLKEKYQNYLPGKINPESILSEEDQFMNDFYGVLEFRYSNAELTVEEIADLLHLSRSQFYRKVKALTGTTPTLLLRDYRLDKSLKIFEQNSGKNISEVAYLVGFSNPKYFSKVYFEKFQIRPGKASTNE